MKDFVICWHRCPAKIQTDGGRPYVLDAILRFCKSFGISQTITAAYHPQSNGKAERVIQTLKNSMKKLQVTSREE